MIDVTTPVAGINVDGVNLTLVNNGSPNGAVVQLVYDDTTLSEHIDEILGYINSENGGSLMSIGFKVGANTISATAQNIQFNADGTNTITSASVTPLTQGDFILATLEHINDNKTSAYFRCAINQISNAIIELFDDTQTRSIMLTNNQITTNAGNGQPLITFYGGVDISSLPLEHLTITYHS